MGIRNRKNEMTTGSVMAFKRWCLVEVLGLVHRHQHHVLVGTRNGSNEMTYMRVMAFKRWCLVEVWGLVHRHQHHVLVGTRNGRKVILIRVTDTI